ncbi:MAG: tetratricopeptide repeat protein [Treponema sp.]|jgi:tetratricopeptide (TPR) repeat protein|nr:tetratricopeptide repeat protein [Treponema sp.]
MTTLTRYAALRSPLLQLHWFFILCVLLGCKEFDQDFPHELLRYTLPERVEELGQTLARRFDRSLSHYYLVGTHNEQKTLARLFALLDQEAPEQTQLAVIREITSIYLRLEEYGVLINFLTAHRQQHPNDPYNAYYLLAIAHSHIRREENAVAALYFDMILKNYPDLTLQGKSIHLACLNRLINLVDDPEQQVMYYQELIARFSDKIDMGISYFMLGQACERIGDWNRALEAYNNYLAYRGTIVPGFPSADYYAKQLVDFNNSDKNWTFERLSSLVSAIKTAFDAGSSNQLQRYQATVNFFTRSWGEEIADDEGMAELSLSVFMSSRLIRYADTLDAGSNANEAYLRTTGWERDISTWYLYFRKIYFPPDPEIHGRWEWAGVYYGERF